MPRRLDGLGSRKQKSARFALLVFGLAVLVAQTRGGAAPPATFAADSLPYSRGFLITGNYVVGGVDFTSSQNPADINGFATGVINFNNTTIESTATANTASINNKVPDGSEIVAAYLYWEAIYVPGAQPTKGVKFRDHFIDPADETGQTAWGTGPILNSQLVLSGPGGGSSPVPGLQWTTIPALPGNTSTCWGAANQTGNARLTMFKYDVLHLLPRLLDGDNRWTGRRLVNNTDLTSNYDEAGLPYKLHEVILPEGTGDQALQSAGASLVVIYRNLSAPLTKIVMYDGAYSSQTMSQTLRGFYQHSQNKGRLTNLVGSGGNNQTERLFFNGTNQQALVATNPFQQTSPSSDRSWSFTTFSNLSMSNVTSGVDGYGEVATETVNHQNANPNPCLAWSSIVFSTPVVDADQDGLPDALEASSTSGSATWRNPNPDDVVSNLNATPNDPADDPELPDIHGMGARTGRKDILIEVNAMATDHQVRYGDATAPYDSAANVPFADVQAHDHMPLPESLKMVGDAFLAKAIHVHFDVGPSLAGGYATAIQNLPWTALGPPVNTDAADNYYIVPAAAARGGESILEPECIVDPQNPANNTAWCSNHFRYFPGTVGWKIGLELYRNAPVKDNGDELETTADVTAWENGTGASTTHRRRFDPLRAPFVRYALYAHARGKPKLLPCLKNGVPTTYPDGTSVCAPYAANPEWTDPLNDQRDYHVPTSSSGVADLPGNNLLITLGLWDAVSGVGTPFGVAATTFHELGHNLNLWHGAFPALLGQKKVAPTPGAPGTSTYIEPNCKPNQSTMNYMFQMHGLIDVNGIAHLDYSDTLLGYQLSVGTPPQQVIAVDEQNLNDLAFTNVPKYQPTWFAPWPSTIATNLGIASAATRFCNGVKFNELDPPLQTQPSMARVWVQSPSQSNDWNVTIDWNGNGQVNSGAASNVNFDAEFLGGEVFSPSASGGSDVLYGANDWGNVRLDQISAGGNVVLRRLEGGLELVSGDTLGGDTLGGDTLGGDTLGGDTLGGDTLGGDTLGGDTLGGDTLGGDTLGGDTLGGDTLGGDTLGGDTLGGDTLGGAEIDFKGAKAFGRATPSSLRVCNLGGTQGQNGCSGTWVDNSGTLHTAQPRTGDKEYLAPYVTWRIPGFGSVFQYIVVRQQGTRITSLNVANQIPTGSPRTSWVDLNNLSNKQTYTYAARGEFDDEGGPHQLSGLSNSATIVAVSGGKK